MPSVLPIFGPADGILPTWLVWTGGSNSSIQECQNKMAHMYLSMKPAINQTCKNDRYQYLISTLAQLQIISHQFHGCHNLWLPNQSPTNGQGASNSPLSVKRIEQLLGCRYQFRTAWSMPTILIEAKTSVSLDIMGFQQSTPDLIRYSFVYTRSIPMCNRFRLRVNVDISQADIWIIWDDSRTSCRTFALGPVLEPGLTHFTMHPILERQS